MKVSNKLMSLLVALSLGVGSFIFFLTNIHRAQVLTSTDLELELEEEEDDSGKPNIFLFLMDDLGWNDLGYQSSDLQSFSPVMTELAENGIKLSKHYSMPICTPARASLLTGKHPVQLGMQHWQIMPTQPWGVDSCLILIDF